jgi:hypothetical protein
MFAKAYVGRTWRAQPNERCRCATSKSQSRSVVSHISRKASEMWGLWGGTELHLITRQRYFTAQGLLQGCQLRFDITLDSPPLDDVFAIAA